MLNQINHNHLYYFWVIVNEGSLKKASQKLHLAVSTISGHLRQLEDGLGSPLFERVSRRLVLNESGSRLLHICDDHFRTLDTTVDQIMSGTSTNRRIMVRVGISTTISRDVLYKVLIRLITDPRYFMKIYEGVNTTLTDSYLRKNLDFLLTDLSFSANFKTAVIPILLKEYWAVCSPKFLKSLRRSSGFPAYLDGAKFVNYTDKNHLHFQILRYFGEQGIAPHALSEIDDVSLLLQATLDGECFAILPLDAIEALAIQKRLIKLGKVENVKNQLNAIINESSLGSSFVDEFDSFLRLKGT